MLRQLDRWPLRFEVFALVLLYAVTVVFAPLTSAEMSKEQRRLLQQEIYYVDAQKSAVCSAASTSSIDPGTNTNFDYTGNRILTDAQLKQIEINQPTYEQAAQAADIPWQMIAVIHLRETGLARNNPSNGQGVYQFVDKRGGPYPSGPVSEAEFLRQTKLAAEFIKGKAAGNHPSNRQLGVNASPEAVKDTFFGYNGRADVYRQQAARLGFNPETQGYEGSPYVMNKADAKRDPAVSPNSWGQIKVDFGGLSYPANNDYGAFVTYAALAGVAMSGNCSTTTSGPVRDRVVAVAHRELELWQNGTMKPGPGQTGYQKYTYGGVGNWCAWFASWVYKQAEYPMAAGNGAVPAVDGIRQLGENGTKFTWHDRAGYRPQPGDLVIQKNGVSHVNIVTAVEGDANQLNITVIGGNQSGDGAGYTASSVTQYTIRYGDGEFNKITGFVSPN